MFEKEESQLMLVYIEGGPFDGNAYESDVLTDHPDFQTDQYRWTPRTIRSTKDPNKVAQVWQHVSVSGDPKVGISPVPSAAENPHSTASEDATREVGMSALLTSQLRREAVSSVALDGETQSLGPDHTGETPDVLDGNPDLPDGEQLFLRRKRLKMTVQEVADQAGLARSKVDAIEKGTGKRIKAAEVLAVVKVLESAEGGGEESPRV